MIDGILKFLMYFGAASAMLAVFVVAYVNFTPYKEFELISKGSVAAAISLSGAVIGFVLPLASAIYFTHSLLEMLAWGGITCAVQFLLFSLFRSKVLDISTGNVASGVMIAAFSIALGVLSAVSISY